VVKSTTSDVVLSNRDESERVSNRIEKKILTAKESESPILDLSDCSLTDIPLEVASLNQLRELRLGNNELTELPPWLGQMQNLQTLIVSGEHVWRRILGHTEGLRGNRLTRLPETLGQLQNLETLDVSGNLLTSLPEWLA